MSEQNQENQTEELEEHEEEPETTARSKEFEDAVTQRVQEELRQMKSNMDKAYAKITDLTKENTVLKDREKELSRKRLADEGKHLELKELELTELKEKLRLAEEKYVRTTRDSTLQSALSSLDFRNEFARNLAFKEIVGELEQEEDGTWIHQSGVPLQEYVRTFSKEPQREFLFKPRENQGSGTSKTENAGRNSKGRPKTLDGLSISEILQLAEEGRLG